MTGFTPLKEILKSHRQCVNQDNNNNNNNILKKHVYTSQFLK